MTRHLAMNKTAPQKGSLPVALPQWDVPWLQCVSASLPEVVIACDLSGAIRYESTPAAQARAADTLPPLAVLLRKCLSDPRDQHAAESVPKLVDRILHSPRINEGCSGHLLLRTCGGLVPSEVSAHALRDGAGRTMGLLIRLQTAVPSWTALRKLMHEASHDALTDLLNRREFCARLNRLIEQRDPNAHHALLMMDLDSFKQVNDLCGHNAGDDALRHIATLLHGRVRSRDSLARFGGDEFCLLMEHCSMTKAVQTAHKLVAAVEEFTFVCSDRVFQFGLSVGVVALSEHHVDPKSVLAEADTACYRVKKRGGHGVAVAQLDASVSLRPFFGTARQE